jgi:excisionase family DNA binding protein
MNYKEDYTNKCNTTTSIKSTGVMGFATVAETAGFFRLSKAMVHKMIGEGKIPACRFGRAVRIPWSWLRTHYGE